MKKSALLTLMALACSCPVRAEVYRCVVGGKLVFTDIACTAGAAPAELAPLSTMDAVPHGDFAKQYDEREARRSAEVRKSRATEAEAYSASKAQAAAIRQGEVEGRIVPGMTRSQVERILNLPTQIEGQGGPHERWVYKNGRDQRTVVFNNGVVANASNGNARKRK